MGDDLSEEIENLEEKIQSSQSSESSSTKNAESMPAQLFGILQQEFEAEKDKGTMNAIRQSGLESIMSRLGKLVDNSGSDQTLEQQIEDRTELNDLMKEMQSRIKNPSFEHPKLPEDSRASRILTHIQAMKTLVGMDNMHTGKSSGESEKATDLYHRLARLTTAVNQTLGDEQQLLQIEIEEARHLMNEVRWYARRHHLTLACPVWSRQSIPQDPNFIFFSGPDEVRDSLQHTAKAIGLTVNPSISLGADTATVRWHNLCTAGLAVFDISKKSPQVFYDLGIALTMGTELLIIAKEGTSVPFDIAQDVWFYSGDPDFREFLTSELDTTLYGLQTKGSIGSSLETSSAYIERLAGTEPDNQNLPVLLQRLHDLTSDPVKTRSVFTIINDSLGAKSHILIYPRWPGVYPNPLASRCFIVMPFREELDKTYDMIQQECRRAGITPCRGDVARGQEIIQSIWEEIGRATHVVVDLTGLNPNVCLELGIADTLGRRTLLIGRQGTERSLFPSIAKRRCHVYHPNFLDEPNFFRAVKNFLTSPKQ